MNNRLLGAICGDVVGSTYEMRNARTKDPKNVQLYLKQSDFTDDTIGTIATADALLHNKSFESAYREWFQKYNARGCGKLFRQWVYDEDPHPYNSYGNGSGMRVSPVGYWCDSFEETLELAKKSAECTHNHPEGIRGAQAIAGAIYMARNGFNKEEIKYDILQRFYPEWLNKTLEEIKPDYSFDSTSQGSVPVAIIAFLESENYEDCIIEAIAMGGDSDTLAAMAGSIANAYYKRIGVRLLEWVEDKLPDEMLDIITEFDIKINEHISNSIR